jgi:hypothetical protein
VLRPDVGQVLDAAPAVLRIADAHRWRNGIAGRIAVALDAATFTPRATAAALVRDFGDLKPGDLTGRHLVAVRESLSGLRAEILAGAACRECGQLTDRPRTETCSSCNPDRDELDAAELAALEQLRASLGVTPGPTATVTHGDRKPAMESNPGGENAWRGLRNAHQRPTTAHRAVDGLDEEGPTWTA